MPALPLHVTHLTKPRDGVLLQTEEYAADMAYLYAELPRMREEYRKTPPFPHLAIDNFLRASALREVIDAFPPRESPAWYHKTVATSYKLSCSEECLIPLPLRHLIRELNAPHFLQWLSECTGIKGLVPDPYLFGSGLFRIEPGGFLKVHVDFNMHPYMRLDRRLNLLLYLNEDWKDEYGGHLELWRAGGSAPEKSIAPVANRCAIFGTTESSFHGHPEPLKCPPGRSRNCISLYYYTNGRPTHERAAPHNTIYMETPVRGASR